MAVLTDAAQSRREQFIQELLASNFTTYFAVTHPKYSKGNKAFRFTPTPLSAAAPHSWKYQEARAKLFELGELLTVEEAERRNINFVNPALRDFMPAATLTTLRGGIQLLLAGEKAYTHRHAANAFRFVLEAPEQGAYTTVEGTKIPMRPGDLVMTPNWTWHDHHNESDTHAIWYDGLDVLMAYFIGGVFSQELKDVSGEEYQQVRHTAEPGRVELRARAAQSPADAPRARAGHQQPAALLPVRQGAPGAAGRCSTPARPHRTTACSWNTSTR